MNNQISLPLNIYNSYIFFEKNEPNLFIFLRKINGIPVKIAKNINNMNYYQIDIPVNKKLDPIYLMKYLKNINYRNYYSSDFIFFKEYKKEYDNKWIEIENYRGVENRYVVNFNLSKFYILFYNEDWYPSNINISQTKYYHCIKILNNDSEYILRFEIILNNMDIDQIIDIKIYLEMLINILKAVHNKFSLVFKFGHNLEYETMKYLELRKKNKK